MNSFVLCLGSNLEPREERIVRALDALSDFVNVESESDFNESADIFGQGEPYINKVVTGFTALSLERFVEEIARIEAAGERQAGPTVSIDIDLVIWNGRIVSVHDFEAPFFRSLYPVKG